MRALFIALLLILSHWTKAQVELFEQGLLSNGQQFGMTISRDGDELFYVKAYGGRDSLRIFRSERLDGKWQEPSLAPFSEKGRNQIDPALSPDGSTMLINAIEPGREDYDIYLVRKNSGGWSRPERLPDGVNTDSHEFYATMAESKNIYFTRRNASNDIYVSRWNGSSYEKAVPLDENVNTEGGESNPYISPKEDFLIFASRSIEGFGEVDLYITFRRGNRWSYPINLGRTVNSKVAEFCPNMDVKNKRFLFSRTVITEDDQRLENMYSIPFKELKLQKLKKEARWE